MAALAHELIVKTNAGALVVVDEGLKQRLAELLASTTKVSRVTLGNMILPTGQVRGTLMLSNALGDQVRIAVRRVGENKFEAIGFSTGHELESN